MKKLKIAFDVDDTILVPRVATEGDYEVPNYEVIAVYNFFKSQGHHMIIWSGSGVDWARTWADKFGLFPDEVIQKKKYYINKTDLTLFLDENQKFCLECERQNPKFESYVDIAFDDCEVDLAKVNVKVSRIKNQVSRGDWNKNKR